MATTFVTALAKGEDSFQTAGQAVRQALDKLEGKQADLAIVFASSRYDYAEVVRAVREATGGAPLIGSSTAGEFTENAVEKGSVAVALISSTTHKFFNGIGGGLRENQALAIEQAIQGLPNEVADHPFWSAIMLIDGLAGKGEEATLAGLSVMGPDVKFAGGAAGDDLKFAETKVFCNDRIEKDAATVCLVASKVPMAISVKHGHVPVTPPMTITKAVDSVLYEVDGKPAFEVWKECLREEAKKEGIDVDALTDATSIGSFLVRYEAGLLTGDDYKMRVPLGANPDGSLQFACTIPESAVIRICRGAKENQVDSARQAAENALAAAGNAKLAGAIVFDCCCRAIILGDEFYRGRDAIKDVLGDIPLIGYETYGEIAMESGQMSGFHNTTTVLLLIPS